MTPANINDPTAIKALLDQLRASRAWQGAGSSRTSPEARGPPAGTLEDVQGGSSAPSASPSVASLLSQLRTSEWTSIAINTPPVSDIRTPSPNAARSPQELPPTAQSEHRTPRPVAATSSARVQDVRSVSFQQALPLLTQLAGDPGFLTHVSRLRQEQNELEQQLWDERQAIHKKHEERVKVARTKATLIGAGLSKHEADMMNDAYRRDLQRFDTERVLLAWDALIQKQQAALETLGVPIMFATTSSAEREKQQRVIHVLEGL